MNQKKKKKKDDVNIDNEHLRVTIPLNLQTNRTTFQSCRRRLSIQLFTGPRIVVTKSE